MGFLDSIKDRFAGPRDDGYGDYDEYDDYDDYGEYPGEAVGDARPRANERHGTGVLGNSSRPAADSVNVHTRGGGVGIPEPRSASTWDSDATTTTPVTPSVRPVPEPAPVHSMPLGVSVPSVPSSYSSQIPAPAPSSQLPPYVLRPKSYDDVQTLLSRVRTNQTVVLVMIGTNLDTAKRILDFAYGFTCGIDGRVTELGDRVFAVCPHGVEVTSNDLDMLAREGIIDK